LNADDVDLGFPFRDPDSSVRATAQHTLPAALNWQITIGFAATYAGLLSAGYALRANSTAVTTLWPADGMLFAALWLLRRRDWPIILCVGFAVDLCLNWLTPGSFHLDSAIWYGVTHVLDGAIGAGLAAAWARTLSTPRDAMMFYVAAAIGCAISTIVGVSAFLSNHPEASLFEEWWRWWAGSFLGVVVIAPVVIKWAAHWRGAEDESARSWWHIVLSNVLIIALTVWIFGATPSSDLGSSLSFAIFPLLVYVALSNPTRWTIVSSAVVVVLAAALTNQALGPFGSPSSPLAGVLSLQVFLALAATMTLMMSLAADENRGLLAALRVSRGRHRHEAQRHANAERRNAQLAALLHHSRELISISTLDGKGDFINAVGRQLIGIGREEPLGGRMLSDFVHPRDRDRLVLDIMPAVIEQGHWSGELDLRRVGDDAEIAMLVEAFRIDDEHGRPLSIAAVCHDITERRRDVERLRALNDELANRVLARTAALKEREVLLQEIHHRVKNNLQVIASLINMQSRTLAGTASRPALQQCRSRVETMAQIHEML
jgi:PAS domain S-box-containing protein